MLKSGDECRISVVVPMFNGEKYIEKCIKSISEQSLKQIEIIIVDDGSNDNSAAICKNLLERDNRIQYYYQTNKGVAAARNEGLLHATGNYVSFIDCDDTISSDMFEKMYSIAEEKDCDIVGCGRKWVSEFEDTMKQVVNEDVYISTPDELQRFTANILTKGNAGYDDRFCFLCFHGYVTNFIFRTKMIKDNHIDFFSFWNDEDDWNFLILAASKAQRIFLLKECMYIYYQNPTSNSHTHRYLGNVYDKRLPSYEWTRSLLKEQNCDDVFIEKYCGKLKRMFILYTLYDVASKNCPLTLFEAYKYLKKIIKKEKWTYCKNYYYKARRDEKIQLWLLMHHFILFTLSGMRLKKYVSNK